MGLLDRIKSSYIYTNWKVGRYTRRRRSLLPHFDQRDSSFYTRNYREGEYLHQEIQRQQMSQDIYLGSSGMYDSPDHNTAEGNEDELRERGGWSRLEDEMHMEPSDYYRENEYTPVSERTMTHWQVDSNFAARQSDSVNCTTLASKSERRHTFFPEVRCSEIYNASW